MPLKLIRNDITRVECDAIVNAANHTLLGGGGVDGAIHRAAGKKLLEECRTLNGCDTGEAKITKGYDLPCRYVIHTVGPIYTDGKHGEEQLLRSCYRNSLKLGLEHQCESMAFPLISAGAYGYPRTEALRIATDEITSFLSDHDMMVYLVIFDQKAFQISSHLYSDIQEYIDQNYAETHSDSISERRRRRNYAKEFISGSFFGRKKTEEKEWEENEAVFPPPLYSSESVESLEERLKVIDESFSEMLLRKIDESGMKDSECYKKANIDRKLFSKIRSNPSYKPSKPTVLAFAIALELPLPETEEMLMKAGFALSPSSKADIIVEYFIKNGNYDIFDINDALFAFDQPTLGV